MKNIIRQILKEDRRQMYLDKIVQVMKDDYPLIKNMEIYGFYDQLSEDELIYVLSEIFGEKEPVKIKVYTLTSNGLGIFNQYDNMIYRESSEGQWNKKEYDENGNEIYFHNSDGDWIKIEYDKKGNKIYYEDSKGYWYKYEYDDRGNEIYYENSDGKWFKYEYDENGNEIYFENSHGQIRDNR